MKPKHCLETVKTNMISFKVIGFQGIFRVLLVQKCDFRWDYSKNQDNFAEKKRFPTNGLTKTKPSFFFGQESPYVRLPGPNTGNF